MRKRIISPDAGDTAPAAPEWIGTEQIAEVELTSEEPTHPIESALRPGDAPGWRAAGPGAQVIRLRFARPQRLSRLHLAFEELAAARTHEFVLRWSADERPPHLEIVRQQFTFSPPGTTREVEDYAVELDGVTALELAVVPDLGGGPSPASLREWHLA